MSSASVAEAAQRLGKNSRSLVYRLLRDGRLDAADDDGQPVRISAAGLARHQAEQRPPGAQLAPPSEEPVAAFRHRHGAGRARASVPFRRLSVIDRGQRVPLAA
jgi:excisionase family DNA binding protein